MADGERKKPITGFVIKSSAFRQLLTMVIAIAACAGVIHAVMKGFYFTQAEAKTHIEKSQQHVQAFGEHEAVAEERYKAQQKQNDKLDEMHIIVTRLGERWKVWRIRDRNREDD